MAGEMDPFHMVVHSKPILVMCKRGVFCFVLYRFNEIFPVPSAYTLLTSFTEVRNTVHSKILANFWATVVSL